MSKEKNIHDLLVQAQSEIKAPKNQRNNFGKYSYRSASDVIEAAKPILVKLGLHLTISDDLVLIGDRYYIRAIAAVTDTTGASVHTTAYAREALTQSGMSDGQVTGATSSYARKYALNGLFAIDDTEDLDSENYQQGAPKATTETKQAPAANNKKATTTSTKKPADTKLSDDSAVLPSQPINEAGANKKEAFKAKYTAKLEAAKDHAEMFAILDEIEALAPGKVLPVGTVHMNWKFKALEDVKAAMSSGPVDVVKGRLITLVSHYNPK